MFEGGDSLMGEGHLLGHFLAHFLDDLILLDDDCVHGLAESVESAVEGELVLLELFYL